MKRFIGLMIPIRIVIDLVEFDPVSYRSDKQAVSQLTLLLFTFWQCFVHPPADSVSEALIYSNRNDENIQMRMLFIDKGKSASG